MNEKFTKGELMHEYILVADLVRDSLMMKADMNYMGLSDETVQFGDILQMSMNKFLDSKKTENAEMTILMEKYKSYKNKYVKNIKFDPTSPSLSMCLNEN